MPVQKICATVQTVARKVKNMNTPNKNLCCQKNPPPDSVCSQMQSHKCRQWLRTLSSSMWVFDGVVAALWLAVAMTMVGNGWCVATLPLFFFSGRGVIKNIAHLCGRSRSTITRKNFRTHPHPVGRRTTSSFSELCKTSHGSFVVRHDDRIFSGFFGHHSGRSQPTRPHSTVA